MFQFSVWKLGVDDKLMARIARSFVSHRRNARNLNVTFVFFARIGEWDGFCELGGPLVARHFEIPRQQEEKRVNLFCRPQLVCVCSPCWLMPSATHAIKSNSKCFDSTAFIDSSKWARSHGSYMFPSAKLHAEPYPVSILRVKTIMSGSAFDTSCQYKWHEL